MRLFHKFFFAFLATTLLTVVLLLSMIGYKLSSDFQRLVTETEHGHLLQVKRSLEQRYAEDGSWQTLLQNEEVWRETVEPGRHMSPPPPRPSVGERNQEKPERQPKNSGTEPPKRIEDVFVINADFLQTGRRITLFDKNKAVVIGRESLADHPVVEALSVEGETVGWLGLIPSSLANDSPANLFLSRQYQLYMLLALLVSVLSLLVAFFVARHFALPLRRITDSTRQIQAGHYDVRVPHQSSDELGQLAGHVNQLAESLDRNQRGRAQWMSDTSHELRTPLTVMKSQLTAVQDKVMVMDDRRLSLLIHEIDGLTRLVNDLAQLSSGDAGGLKYHMHQADPFEWLEEVLSAFQVRFQETDLNLHIQQDVGHGRVLADEGRIKQLFSNLLENSLRYTEASGTIRVKVTAIENTWQFTIEDSYPGVNDDQLERLFDRFYRTEKSRNRQRGGSGLGLAICQQIVQAHHGCINAAHSELGGVSIQVTLPLIEEGEI